jgi:hypothetical protein
MIHSETLEKILSNGHWTVCIEAKLKSVVYGKLKNYAREHPYICRVLSPLIGLSGTFMTVVTSIIQVAEDIFLGVTHLFLKKKESHNLKVLDFAKLTVLDTLTLIFNVATSPLLTLYITFNTLKNGESFFEFLEGAENKKLDLGIRPKNKELFPDFFKTHRKEVS